MTCRCHHCDGGDECPESPNYRYGGEDSRPATCSRFDVPSTADHILAGAMEKLAESIVSGDGVANAAIREAGQRITVLAHEIKLLRDQLKIADKALEGNIDVFCDLRNANSELREALKTVIVVANENPDMLVLHILASDSPIRRVWERHGVPPENTEL